MLAGFGVDVLDPGTSLRRIWSLLQRLPPRGREAGLHWSAEAELLATLVDQVADLTWVTLKANGAKSVQRPKPIPRPGRDGRRPPSGSPASPPQRRPGKTGSWMEAIGRLAGTEGVKVRSA